jgi:hypothetical protein
MIDLLAEERSGYKRNLDSMAGLIAHAQSRQIQIANDDEENFCGK